MCLPIQHFLKVRSQAESVTTGCRDVDQTTSPLHPAAQLLVDFGAWRADAIAASWWVLSGSAGRKIVCEYSDMMVDLEDAG